MIREQCVSLLQLRTTVVDTLMKMKWKNIDKVLLFSKYIGHQFTSTNVQLKWLFVWKCIDVPKSLCGSLCNENDN